MKKNGFTLIELLAVIIALAIVLAIAVPRVLNLIDDSKKTAFEISANKLLNEAKKEYSKYALEKEYIIENKEFVNDSFELQGELPENGSIKVFDDGTVSLAVHNDKWCALKRNTEEEIQIIPYEGECQIFTPVACFTYTKTATEATITDYDNTCTKDVVIPSTLDGLPVTTIGPLAFNGNSLSSVVIPDSVTSIDYWAFYVNQLSNVKIPSSVVSIGDEAFGANQLTILIISNGVETIGNFAFSNNQLTSLTIPNSLTNIGDAAFNDNNLSDTEAFIYARNPDGSVDTTKVVSYGGLKRSNVIIPNGVTTIGSSAFSYNQLTSVIIPISVILIETRAFSSNLLTSVTIPSNVTIYTGAGLTPSISSTFYTSYVTVNGSAGGTYTAPSQSGTWTKQ